MIKKEDWRTLKKYMANKDDIIKTYKYKNGRPYIVKKIYLRF